MHASHSSSNRAGAFCCTAVCQGAYGFEFSAVLSARKEGALSVSSFPASTDRATTSTCRNTSNHFGGLWTGPARLQGGCRTTHSTLTQHCSLICQQWSLPSRRTFRSSFRTLTCCRVCASEWLGSCPMSCLSRVSGIPLRSAMWSWWMAFMSA